MNSSADYFIQNIYVPLQNIYYQKKYNDLNININNLKH